MKTKKVKQKDTKTKNTDDITFSEFEGFIGWASCQDDYNFDDLMLSEVIEIFKNL